MGIKKNCLKGVVYPIAKQKEGLGLQCTELRKFISLMFSVYLVKEFLHDVEPSFGFDTGRVTDVGRGESLFCLTVVIS